MIKKISNGWQPGSLAGKLRQQRLALLCKVIDFKKSPIKILDIGGQDSFWNALDTSILPCHHITFLNIFEQETKLPNAVSLVGDGRNMQGFADGSFDLAFSNSVIEHVGGLRDQKRMADECQRVAISYFLQTPNRYFPVEPHFLLPGFQFLPACWRALFHSRMNLGWWPRSPSYFAALEEVESIRLLTKSEISYLFEQGTIWEEKIFGLTKSFVVYGHAK